MSERKPTAHWADRRLWEIQPARDLIVLAAGLLLVQWALVLGYMLRAIFTPVLIALVLAYLFTPWIDWMERRWRAPRSVVILGILAVVLGALAGLGLWAGPLVVEQASSLLRALPGYVRDLGRRYDVEMGDVAPQIEALVARVRAAPLEVLKPVFAGTSQAFGLIGSVLSTTMYVLLTLVLIPVYFFSFAMNFDAIKRKAGEYIPRSRRERVVELLGQIDKVVSAFFRGRVVIALLMAGMFAAGWCPWVTDVPYWALLSLATGLLSLVPYAAAVGWLLAVGLKALTMTGVESADAWQWAVALGGPTLVYVAVQFVEGWILTPLIQGKAMDLGPVTILIVVFVGGALGGLYGLLLAIPIAASVKILLREVALPRLAEWVRRN